MDPIAWNSRRYRETADAAGNIRIKRVIPLVGQAGRVIDIACLDGAVAAIFQELGNTVYGIDASETAIEKARQRGIKVQLGNLEEPLPYADAAFDLAFAGEIIEHIFNIDGLLDEIYRILKPGGTLIVTTPNLAAFGRRLLLLLNRNPNIEISFTGDAAGHIRYFIKRNLFDLLSRHSFVPVYFTSDVVNFNRAGNLRSHFLAAAFPTLGRSLIVKAKKTEKLTSTRQ